MKNLLALLGLVVVGFAGVGWYMGWYKLSVSRHSDGTLQVQTNVDTHKVVDDSGRAIKRGAEYIGEQIDKAPPVTVRDGAPPVTTPGPLSTPAPAPQPPAAKDPSALKEGAGWLIGHVFSPANERR